MTKASAFARLHPKIQQRIHDPDMRWPKLRPIQVEAIHHVLDDQGDAIITAPTAGGKTEAAFLPILSKVADDASTSVRALYVGPLKALIDDQFRRVDDLCARLELPVHRWHGDVNASARKKLLSRPSGVLLITPESLEAMFCLRSSALPAVFAALDYVVIDELHAFVGTVRGAQLRSLLYRLQLLAGRRPTRIGLSATLGEPEKACGWLSVGAPPARIIADSTQGQNLELMLRGFWQVGQRDPTLEEGLSEELREEDLNRQAMAVLKACQGRTNLVFANAKSRIEELAVRMSEQAKSLSLRDEIVVHHGSLSKDERHYSEERLRQETLPVTAVCSNTLEMGIDIGAIDRVVQVSAPWSVASLRQRMGRSGRREGDPAVLIATLSALRPPWRNHWESLQLDFLRGLASIELMLEGYVEPPDYERRHLSTLVQQLLSVLRQTNGTQASDLFAVLKGSGAFAHLDVASFQLLLRELGAKDIIEQMPDGTLILAGAGERLTGHYTFYAAFQTPKEFQVTTGELVIGQLSEDRLPPVGQSFLLAGKKWTVRSIDGERAEVLVERARKGSAPMFSSGGQEVHRVLHEKMMALGAGADVPSYLDDEAEEILESIRQEGRKQDAFRRHLRSAGTKHFCYLWAGSRIQRTVFLAFSAAGFAVSDQSIGLEIEGDEEEVRRTLQRIADGELDGEKLARHAEEKLDARSVDAEKYDAFVSTEEWRTAYAAELLDLAVAARLCTETIR